MRAAELQKAKPVIYMLGAEHVKKFSEIDAEDEEIVERAVKNQFREASEEIIQLQKQMTEPTDGFILYLDNIYKVHAKSAGMIKKITGEEARQAKKILKDK